MDWWLVDRNAEVGAAPQVFGKFGGSSNYKNWGTGWLLLEAVNEIE